MYCSPNDYTNSQLINFEFYNQSDFFSFLFWSKDYFGKEKKNIKKNSLWILTNFWVFIYPEIPALKPLGYQPVSCKLWSKQSSKINKHFFVKIYISQFSSWFYFAFFWNNFGALFFALVLIVLTPLNFIFWLWSCLKYVRANCFGTLFN